MTEEQQEHIVVGTTVRLRDIPGPLMRVIRIQGQQATCFWFSRHNEACEEQFPTILLAKMAPYVHTPKPPFDPAAAERFEREIAPVAEAADH